MGLDAFVYCDCYEKGKLKTQPPDPELVYVDKNGRVDCRNCSDEQLDSFDLWVESQPCEHEEFTLADCYVGNAWLVRQFHEVLVREHWKFPVILFKVLYNGTHTGDAVYRDDILCIEKELNELKKFKCDDPEMNEWLRDFRKGLSLVVKAALKVDKPIVF